jgi:hypothetical protein
VKGDAAETGLQNGNGRIRPPEAPNPGEALLVGRCGELLHFGGFVLNASANGHHAENLPGENSTDVMEPADRYRYRVQRNERVLPDAQRNVFGHKRVLPRILVAFAILARNLNQPLRKRGRVLDGI